MNPEKILVAGGGGQVGRALQASRCGAGYEVVCAPKARLDITRPASIQQTLDALRPRFVINAAAYTAVDRAEAEGDAAFSVNLGGAENLARHCAQSGIALLHLSTDYVFDGAADTPYKEDSPPAPVNLYGRSKWAGEQAVQSACRRHIIVRTSGVFGAHGGNFVKTMVALAKEKERLDVVVDQTLCPTPATDIAGACLEIARQVLEDEAVADSRWGTYHYCSNDPVSWYDFAEAIIAARRKIEPLSVKEIRAIPTSEFPTPAARPPYSALCCDKVEAVFGVCARSWRGGLAETVKSLTDEK